MHTTLPVVDTRTGEPLYCPHDTPRCRKCNRRFYPPPSPFDNGEADRASGAAHRAICRSCNYCRHCRNAIELARHQGVWWDEVLSQ